MIQNEWVQMADKQSYADLEDTALVMELERQLHVKQREMLRAAHAHFSGLSFPTGWFAGDGKGNLQPEQDGAHNRPLWAQPCAPFCADYTAYKHS